MTKPDASQAGTLLLGGELEVHRLDFGAMRVTGSGVWGEPPDRAECIATLQQVPELGVNFIDTADAYGPMVSEPMLREALHPYAPGLIIATKGGQVRPGPNRWVPLGRRDYLLQQVKMSLRLLGLEQIALWQLHRIDNTVPVGEQFRAIKSMLQDGLIRFAGLSEVSVAEIQAAQDFFPVTSVQNQYSVGNRSHEAVLDYCAAQGIAFIPWNPLQGGRLARHDSPLRRVAHEHGATPSQIALAWLLRRSPVMLPIPGTSRRVHLEENVAAANIRLTDAEFQAIADAAAR